MAKVPISQSRKKSQWENFKLSLALYTRSIVEIWFMIEEEREVYHPAKLVTPKNGSSNIRAKHVLLKNRTAVRIPRVSHTRHAEGAIYTECCFSFVLPQKPGKSLILGPQGPTTRQTRRHIKCSTDTYSSNPKP